MLTDIEIAQATEPKPIGEIARIAGVELAVIDENTNARQFEKELELSEMYHRLNNRH